VGLSSLTTKEPLRTWIENWTNNTGW
jgi:hypothetical protein